MKAASGQFGELALMQQLCKHCMSQADLPWPALMCCHVQSSTCVHVLRFITTLCSTNGWFPSCLVFVSHSSWGKHHKELGELNFCLYLLDPRVVCAYYSCVVLHVCTVMKNLVAVLQQQ